MYIYMYVLQGKGYSVLLQLVSIGESEKMNVIKSFGRSSPVGYHWMVGNEWRTRIQNVTLIIVRLFTTIDVLW